MDIGAFTRQFDLPLLLVQLFFLFFLALVYYLRQEDKREGYPLVSDRADRTGGRIESVGYPPMPEPKAFIQPHGRPTVYAPRYEDLPPIKATNLRNGIGMPIDPIGDPLASGTGAASWLPKIDEPDLGWEGDPVFQPLRAADGFHVMKGDPDPRGFSVFGMDGERAGTVVDIWVDKGEHHARFLEVALDAPLVEARRPSADEDGLSAPPDDGRRVEVVDEPVETDGGVVRIRSIRPVPQDETRRVEIVDEPVETDGGTVEIRSIRPVPPGTPAPVAEPEPRPDYGDRSRYADAARVPAPGGRVLLPTEFASVNGRKGVVRSAAISARQFADIPGRKADTILTAREEQRIRGYFGGGLLWNTTGRLGPLL